MFRFGRFAQSLRRYRVLAIESSCDDSAVCLINRVENEPPILEDHLKLTMESAKDGGIIPIDALAHHLEKIAVVAQDVLNRNHRPKIDLVCATQGPGMFSSLAAGLQVGKGLAVAWNVPFLGVHHMLGHLLTPRFFPNGPKYPFLSLLISGGHTMLVFSKSITDHKVLANTIDNAAGNALDKCARHLGLEGNMLGKVLDEFTKSGDTAPLPAGLEFPLPLEKSHNGNIKTVAFSFAHFSSLIPREAKKHKFDPVAEQPEAFRRSLGIKIQAAVFDHIVRKVDLALKHLIASKELEPDQEIDFVCSGGVAANSVLRQKIQTLNSPLRLKMHFTPLQWCTDNALMIGWAGIEMYESGFRPDLEVIPVAKWPLDEFGS